MSLASMPDGWMRFGGGRSWRCRGPRYLCEVDDARNTPNYCGMASTVAKLRRVKGVYAGRVKLGRIDEMGTGMDILVANAMTESFGTVPSPLSTSELRGIFAGATGIDPGVKLDEVIRYVAMQAKFLERRESGYVNPVSTPHRVSVGAHHTLISTAQLLISSPASVPGDKKIAEITDLVCGVPAESLVAAEFAIRYFDRSYSKHLNQPPLLAATYNAGAPRLDPTNPWNLKQHGNHVDRWVAYYNTSRMTL
jgi:hypothetical protein